MPKGFQGGNIISVGEFASLRGEAYEKDRKNAIAKARNNKPKNQFIEEKLWADQEDDLFKTYKRDNQILTVGDVKFPYNGKQR